MLTKAKKGRQPDGAMIQKACVAERDQGLLETQTVPCGNGGLQGIQSMDSGIQKI